ncbi:hypothetical protein KBB96_02005 [Luteolibacter ambystomatis]|uniref:Uncharacterized protein n=1 Tax=Luteolibacter ambystomatis TaxID=2824561 RepID=A0A975J0B5_9BACT|nr:hypothetical protein [Luteolibacter ambystomatis]QUE51677.1 hypothetical protein KBB96_02005 [Luteolibacter ambystomatis]
MPSDSREPENYSISEMMDRLKERSGGDRSNGELVTRADGTQAIKVRSRKRRSHQPHRENEQRERRMRAVQLVGLVVVIVLLLAVATGVVVYMNGSPYRNKIMGRVAEATGAKADVTEFRVTPIGANASTLSLEWPEGQTLKKLNLQGVTAELRFSSFLGQPWTGEEIAAQKGELLVGMSSGDAALKDGVDFFRFNRLRCADLSVYFGDPRSPALSILGSEMSLYPKGAGGRPELRCNHGRVKFGRKLPELELDRATIGVTGRRLDIVNFRLLEPGEGEGIVEIIGQVEPSDSGRATTLDTKVRDMPVELLVGPELGTILRGRVESRSIPQSNFLTFDPSKPDSLKLVMSFQGVGDPPMTLSQLPFLSKLRGIFKDSGYERPVFDGGATGVLRISGSEVSLSDLRLEAMSRMTIRGNMAIGANKALSGRLEVGLPIRLVESEPQLDAAFGARKEDLRWLEVNLSGTTDVPADDFGRKVVNGSPSGSAAGGAASEFENLTRPR